MTLTVPQIPQILLNCTPVTSGLGTSSSSMSLLSIGRLSSVARSRKAPVFSPTCDLQMLAQDASAQAAEKAMITDYNTKLAMRASQFAQNNTGVSLFRSSWDRKWADCRQVTTWLWDSNAAFTTVLNDPTAYGFVDAVSYGNTGDFWG